MKIKIHKDLLVWQKSMNLAKSLYEIVQKLPKEEKYALSDQLRRASVSIPSNIAEGFGRHSPKDYAHFLSMARGSAFELETQLILCEQIHFLTNSDTKPLLDTISELTKMFNSLINKLLNL